MAHDTQQPQLAITAVNSISKESFNATSVRSLLSDVTRHTITLDQILNLDDVEKHFTSQRPPAAVGPAKRRSDAPPPAVSVKLVKVVNGAPVGSHRRPEVAATVTAPLPPPPPPSQPQHSAPVLREIETAARALLKDTGLIGHQLFRCAEPDCTATADDQKAFNVHMMKHVQSSALDYPCYHCNVRSKNILALSQHIVSHSRHSYFCMFCDHTGAKNTDMIRHMRDTHNRNNLLNVPLNPTAQVIPGSDGDCNQLMVSCPRGTVPAKTQFMFGKQLLERYRRREEQRNKRHFKPTEVDQLPPAAILFSPIICSQCGFSTKVRTNMVRHLQSCENEIQQPQQQQQQRRQKQQPQQQQDAVNPVPCLDTGELHFDRMRNLACSSNDDSASASTSAQDMATAKDMAVLVAIAEKEVSAFVPETNR